MLRLFLSIFFSLYVLPVWLTAFLSEEHLLYQRHRLVRIFFNINCCTRLVYRASWIFAQFTSKHVNINCNGDDYCIFYTDVSGSVIDLTPSTNSSYHHGFAPPANPADGCHNDQMDWCGKQRTTPSGGKLQIPKETWWPKLSLSKHIERW